MRIKKIVNQHRRDFIAIYLCEYCGAEHEGSGYDDEYFHTEVVPSMVCEKCNRKANAKTYKARQTKYPADMQV